MIDLPEDLSPELVPLSWLLGSWQGTGVVSYEVDGEPVEFEFGQRVTFAQDGMPFLRYQSYSWRLAVNDDDHDDSHGITFELGVWRLSRPVHPGDRGPGLLMGTGEPFATDADTVEGLRTPSGGFPIEVSILHPEGISELYVGEVHGPRIEMGTDAVLRPANAREYSSATRMFGLVEGKLMWAWDIAAFGQPLASHASAVLERVEDSGRITG